MILPKWDFTAYKTTDKETVVVHLKEIILTDSGQGRNSIRSFERYKFSIQ
jgi:hypothetical protein